MNAETKWTPGPWARIDTPDYAEIHPASGKAKSPIALVGRAEDADLIAAAPEMAEALRPFGNIDFSGTVWEGKGIADETPVFLNRAGQTITVGDFRRAAAALLKAGG